MSTATSACAFQRTLVPSAAIQGCPCGAGGSARDQVEEIRTEFRPRCFFGIVGPEEERQVVAGHGRAPMQQQVAEQLGRLARRRDRVRVAVNGGPDVTKQMETQRRSVHKPSHGVVFDATPVPPLATPAGPCDADLSLDSNPPKRCRTDRLLLCVHSARRPRITGACERHPRSTK